MSSQECRHYSGLAKEMSGYLPPLTYPPADQQAHQPEPLPGPLRPQEEGQKEKEGFAAFDQCSRHVDAGELAAAHKLSRTLFEKRREKAPADGIHEVAGLQHGAGQQDLGFPDQAIPRGMQA